MSYIEYPTRTEFWKTSDGRVFYEFYAAHSHQRSLDFQPVIDQVRKNIRDCFKNPETK